MRTRALVGRYFLSDRIGQFAGWWFKQKIPHRGLTVSTASKLVSDGVRTALVVGAYESAEFRFVDRFLPADCDVIELGASIGVMTCQLLRRTNPGTRVISVEADARLMPLIRDNVDRNCERAAILLNRAVHYGGASHAEFSFGDDTLGGRIDAMPVSETTKVEAVTFSRLVADHDCRSFSVVSDIEGAEWDLWDQDKAALLRARICVFELHDSFDGRTAGELMELIRSDPDFDLLASYGNVVAFRPRAS
jgi:FkbM family methyltransferase